MIPNGSLMSLDRTNVFRYYNTGSALPGSTNTLIVIVMLFGSLRDFVIMNLLLAFSSLKMCTCW